MVRQVVAAELGRRGGGGGKVGDRQALDGQKRTRGAVHRAPKLSKFKAKIVVHGLYIFLSYLKISDIAFSVIGSVAFPFGMFGSDVTRLDVSHLSTCSPAPWYIVHT
jgi:hypothetical protein